MKDIKFGNVQIGSNNPTVIIAEIAVSHNGDLETAKKLVNEAKKAGADIAKFQLHLADIEMVPGSINMWGGPLYDILLETHFEPEVHGQLMEYCKSAGIQYLCTPFCPAAVDVLDELGVEAFKTGSGELTNLPMQRKIASICAKKQKAAIVSTGMSNWNEIADTVKVYEQEGSKDKLVLTNCTSEYPPSDYSHANLGLIPKMQNEFGVWVGQSDHTLDNYTAFAAVALGAKVIEKHFTMDRNQRGPDHSISLEPQMLSELVDGIRKIDVGMGTERTVSKEEQVVRDWAYHSVVSTRDIQSGEEINLENVMPKRPGSGIEAKYLDKNYSEALLGKKALKDLPKDTILTWHDLQ